MYKMTDIAEGAKAATQIQAQPMLLEQEQARTKILQGQADSSGAISKYNKARYESLLGYMQDDTGMSPPPDSSADGDDVYSLYNTPNTISQKEAEIEAEKSRVKKLSLEDQVAASTIVKDMEASLAGIKEQQAAVALKQTQKQSALLNSITDEKSLQGARNYLKGTIEAAADRAIQEGKLPKEMKEAFIREELSDVLPDKYDSAGKAMIASNRDELLTSKEQMERHYKEKNHQMDKKKHSLDIAKHNLDIRKVNVDVANGSKQANSDMFKSLAQTRQASTMELKAIKDTQRDISGLERDRRGATEFEKARIDDDLRVLRADLKGYQDSNKNTRGMLNMQLDMMYKSNPAMAKIVAEQERQEKLSEAETARYQEAEVDYDTFFAPKIKAQARSISLDNFETTSEFGDYDVEERVEAFLEDPKVKASIIKQGVTPKLEDIIYELVKQGQIQDVSKKFEKMKTGKQVKRAGLQEFEDEYYSPARDRIRESSQKTPLKDGLTSLAGMSSQAYDSSRQTFDNVSQAYYDTVTQDITVPSNIRRSYKDTKKQVGKFASENLTDAEIKRLLYSPVKAIKGFTKEDLSDESIKRALGLL